MTALPFLNFKDHQTEYQIDWYAFLGRPKLPAASTESLELLRNSSILVTGAGGSIGTALSLRLAGLRPRNLVLIDASEQALYRLHSSFQSIAPAPAISTILANVADSTHMDEIFAAHNPDFVFHAAAYKHLPLGEENPLAAIANNALATHTLVECATRSGTSRIVLLSTDKAVEPTSILGATKRIAEQITLANGGVVVRLANVLGTEGSVVEVFLQQITTASPLTITNGDAERYFLTRDESIDLLLNASTRAPGSLLVPELHNAHSIVSLAKFLLATCMPRTTLPLTFVPSRTGEKTREALCSNQEFSLAIADDGVLCIPPQPIDVTRLHRLLIDLKHATQERDLARAIELVCEFVPAYTPSPTVQRLANKYQPATLQQ